MSVRTTALPVRCKRLVLWVQVMTPKNTRERLREKFCAVVIVEQPHRISAVDLSVILLQPSLRVLAERRDQRAIRRRLNEDWRKCEIVGLRGSRVAFLQSFQNVGCRD